MIEAPVDEERPPIEEPVVEEPVAAQPVEPPVAEEPIAEEPVAEEPVIDEPVAADPAPAAPAPAEPVLVVPGESAPDAADAAPTGDERGGASASEAISIRGLVKQFGDNRAVDGIDLTVPAGSFYGIVGPNGAGKTTTLSIVAGLLRPDEGSVTICGIDQSRKPLAAKRVMGVLPDRLRTFDRLTGRQLLYYYGLLRGLASDVIEKRAADLARAFDLADALSRVVSDYSAGMTKKIMLAGAMIHSPRVLVLDEPFEAVDPVSSAVILDILRAYVAHGGTVILSSHGMDLVERVCSRVAIIVGGEVLAEGTIDEVRAGQSLEARFVELAGSSGEVEGLEWLHTFSD
ncbi:ATP-binding cassette domain-containing protein [Microbacterium sp. 179-I 3D2 NHS]